MGLQTHPPFAALLTGVAIPHQAGHAQIFVQPRRVLILAPLEFRVIEARDIHLHVLYDENGNRKRDVLHHADHLLDIGLDRRWQPPTASASGSVEKPFGSVPPSGSTALAAITPILYLVFHILAMVDVGSEQDLVVADTGQTGHTASFVDATGDGLDLPFTLPRELDRKGAMRDDLGLACP